MTLEEEEEYMVEGATERYGELPTGRKPNMKLHTERSLGSLAMAPQPPVAGSLHPMEGAKVLKMGMAYSQVVTPEGKVMAVPNEELRAAFFRRKVRPSLLLQKRLLSNFEKASQSPL